MVDVVLQYLADHKYAKVKETVREMHYADVAEVFENLEDPESAQLFFRLLPKDIAAEVFSYMEAEDQERVISSVSDRELRFILDELYLDDYVDLVEEMPANVVKRVLKNSSPESRKLINQYLQYPEDSAGSLMTNEYVYLKRGTTVNQALSVIRTTGVDKETINKCYVLDPQHHLEGVVTLRDIILADPDTVMADIMRTSVISVNTNDDQEEVAKMFYKYDMLAMPVVDNENRLVGIITIDDVVDVVQEEVTEDFEKMAGILPSEDTYLKTPVFTLFKSRILWLMVLMVSAMVSGALITHFESAISALPLLVSFIPMLMGTGGNSGSQSSTTIIRSMALDEVELSDFFRVWWKEVRVALLCGVALGAVNYARIAFQYHDGSIAMTVSLTLVVTVVVAKSLGCILPMLAKKLKLDPALMASPMLTTITDACSILVFFLFVTLFLGNRL
ncbi:MAG: magnesium transporter [Clostridia bacterium]|nr:magnesium transporter [Clostridia bacterium]